MAWWEIKHWGKLTSYKQHLKQSAPQTTVREQPRRLPCAIFERTVWSVCVYAQPEDDKGLLASPIIFYDYIQNVCPSVFGTWISANKINLFTWQWLVGKRGQGIKGPRVKFLSALGNLLGLVSTYVHTFIPPNQLSFYLLIYYHKTVHI
jgi:hypothetical protein